MKNLILPMKLLRSRQRNPIGNFLRLSILVPAVLMMQVGVVACAAEQNLSAPFQIASNAGNQLEAVPLAVFDQPWAMAFLPDGRLLVTEKPGNLWLLDFSAPVDSGQSEKVPSIKTLAAKKAVAGLPPISAGGQGGLGDVVPHPQFATNQLVYLSYVERSGNLSGAVVARAKLQQSDGQAVLTDWEMLWEQSPKVSGQGHYGYRLGFSSDGFLYITSGDRQKFDPAQDMNSNLGKVLRLHDDGRVPEDNPFAAQGGVAAQVWSLGHRNPLGMAFDETGQLWAHEMGPRGGDELNRVVRGKNYGYPLVSNGTHYNGDPISDHDTRPEFEAPAMSWTPVISPAGLLIYTGSLYEGWRGTGIMGGLSSRSLVRVTLDVPATEIERFRIGQRIREVEQGPDGFVYLLEDGADANFLRLDP